MDSNNSRRSFLTTMSLGLVATGIGAGNAQAFTLKNPGRDKQDPRYIGQKGKRFGMVIDLRKCVGCQACTASCKCENNVPTGQYRTYVSEYEIGVFPNVRKAFLPQLCNHCENPSCVSVCPTGATFKREDGIVVVDDTVCWGCGYCINACPYDKRFFNKLTKVADKCTFCAHRVDKGLLPACVETCVGGARVFGDLNNPNSEISKLLNMFPTNVMKKDQGTNPRVFYIGLNDEISDIPVSEAILDDLAKKIDKTPLAQWSVAYEGGK
ncbi:sulfate reduction electron transfer complex DsrMKJOP subunit DsrO [Helicobacter sp. 11S03491-1]|uniref:sulfate reduction electron transfer complex DsrMKJOP subunit DsrO n=1 Tax=Helicobacter sp. 11S03491-1 TaxID=1476196 RepID=UPI000BA57D48|nr:4Fe-4S dicluster domain-containing protein [Helicobacter sp. 11S03491-1]PAF42667.1 4Fe-4S ferredoxin [Helicobacter sp. 11S03491-1]